jgi:hypothetical protein
MKEKELGWACGTYNGQERHTVEVETESIIYCFVISGSVSVAANCSVLVEYDAVDI